jgi:hypothetical protein
VPLVFAVYCGRAVSSTEKQVPALREDLALRTPSIIAALALAFLFATHAACAQQKASLGLLQRAIDPNPTLKSYTGSAHLSATLHVLLPVTKSFDGAVYYLRPKRKIAFQNVPHELENFKNQVSSTPTYEEMAAQYSISPLTDDGSASSYLLVPKKAGGRVKSVTISVDDRSMLITHAQWAYTNGATLTFDETYETVGTFHLPAQANIAARFPGYSVDGTMTFSNYIPNATVSSSIFTTSN